MSAACVVLVAAVAVAVVVAVLLAVPLEKRQSDSYAVGPLMNEETAAIRGLVAAEWGSRLRRPPGDGRDEVADPGAESDDPEGVFVQRASERAEDTAVVRTSEAPGRPPLVVAAVIPGG